jgi:hypothetical protein
LAYLREGVDEAMQALSGKRGGSDTHRAIDEGN